MGSSKCLIAVINSPLEAWSADSLFHQRGLEVVLADSTAERRGLGDCWPATAE